MSDYEIQFGRASSENERINYESIYEEEMESDVPGLYADGTYKKGIDHFPIFNVNQKEFECNMAESRQRLRFSGKAGQYLRESRYKRSFYIRYTNESGKTFIRKVK